MQTINQILGSSVPIASLPVKPAAKNMLLSAFSSRPKSSRIYWNICSNQWAFFFSMPASRITTRQYTQRTWIMIQTANNTRKVVDNVWTVILLTSDWRRCCLILVSSRETCMLFFLAQCFWLCQIKPDCHTLAQDACTEEQSAYRVHHFFLTVIFLNKKIRYAKFKQPCMGRITDR